MSEIAVAVTLQVKPEFKDAFVAELKRLAAETRKEEGNIAYDLCQSQKDPLTFMILERWKSDAACAHHETLPHFKNFIAFVPGKAEEKGYVRMDPVKV